MAKVRTMVVLPLTTRAIDLRSLATNKHRHVTATTMLATMIRMRRIRTSRVGVHRRTMVPPFFDWFLERNSNQITRYSMPNYGDCAKNARNNCAKSSIIGGWKKRDCNAKVL